ncbi:MAG: MBL fold metallo-hydrolase [Bacteroidetes bacterium CHB5]|nr:MBL fold metallo-hydrolase [Bacteroidetes bacterium CHB5]
MMKVQTFTFNPFQENTFVVYDESGEAAIIDPGCYQAHEKTALSQFIDLNKLTVKLLLNTHCHIDHVLGNDFVKSKYNVPLLIHEKELPVLKAVKSYASNYGFATYQEALPDRFLKEGDWVSFGNTKLQVLFLPGHAPGHIGFYQAETNSLLSGDVLFENSIGRTDLPGGDHNTLIQSIRQKVFVLPDETVVYPGHGNTTTVGEEKISNPFCAISATR